MNYPNSTLSILRLLMPITFLLVTVFESSGQKVLQLETRGKIKTKKFYEGDELYVKLKIDKFWRQATIIDIQVDDNIVEFDFGSVTLDEIEKFKTPKQNIRGRRIRRSMLMSGASFALFTPLELIYQDDPNYNLIAGGLSIGVLGVLLKPIVDMISMHRIGGRKRLRLLDLSFQAPDRE